MAPTTIFEAIVIGVSAGGTAALTCVVPAFGADFPLPIMVVQHRGDDGDGFLEQHLGTIAEIAVVEAVDKMPIEAGVLYLAPAGYHLQVEQTRIFSLSVDAKVAYSRPSIDVLFASAAAAYGARLVGVILTGASSDGSSGLRIIKEHGGLTIVQDPRTAESSFMPQAALDACPVDHVLELSAIGPYLNGLGRG